MEPQTKDEISLFTQKARRGRIRYKFEHLKARGGRRKLGI